MTVNEGSETAQEPRRVGRGLCVLCLYSGVRLEQEATMPTLPAQHRPESSVLFRSRLQWRNWPGATDQRLAMGTETLGLT